MRFNHTRKEADNSFFWRGSPKSHDAFQAIDDDRRFPKLTTSSGATLLFC